MIVLLSAALNAIMWTAMVVSSMGRGMEWFSLVILDGICLLSWAAMYTIIFYKEKK